MIKPIDLVVATISSIKTTKLKQLIGFKLKNEPAFFILMFKPSDNMGEDKDLVNLLSSKLEDLEFVSFCYIDTKSFMLKTLIYTPESKTEELFVCPIHLGGTTKDQDYLQQIDPIEPTPVITSWRKIITQL